MDKELPESALGIKPPKSYIRVSKSNLPGYKGYKASVIFRSTIGTFVLSCDPGFARLFDNLFADEMRALAQFVDSQRASLLGCGLLAQFSKEGFKSLHYSYLSSKYW